jgi:hypothetical protein
VEHAGKTGKNPLPGQEEESYLSGKTTGAIARALCNGFWRFCVSVEKNF